MVQFGLAWIINIIHNTIVQYVILVRAKYPFVTTVIYPSIMMFVDLALNI
jgi:hypothetical protein